MPDFYSYKEIDLDEAIKYFNDYYERVKDTSNEGAYIIELDTFINPKFNSEKIDNLEAYKYTVISKKSPRAYRLDIFDDKKKYTTDLTIEQIKELQKFNDYLKQSEVKAYIKRSGIWMAIITFTVLLLIIVWCLNT